jgi:hypothetical protein
MLLIYDHRLDAYVGERLTVPRWLFDQAVEELVEGGEDEGKACARLLDEREWAGVEGVERAQLCLHCREPLSRPRRFCGAVCEAAFVAAAHGG